MEDPNFYCCSACWDKHRSIKAQIETKKDYYDKIYNIGNLMRGMFKCCGYKKSMGIYVYLVAKALQNQLNDVKNPYDEKYQLVREHLFKIIDMFDDLTLTVHVFEDNYLALDVVSKFGILITPKYNTKKYKKKLIRKLEKTELETLRNQILTYKNSDVQEINYKKIIDNLNEEISCLGQALTKLRTANQALESERNDLRCIVNGDI
jgi:hypothetical protein